MEDSAENTSGSPRSPRQTNIAQRFSRQISRTILPALRNLVRSNRTQRSRTPDTEQSPIVSTTTSSLPLVPETIPQSQPIENDNLDNITDLSHNNINPDPCTNVQDTSATEQILPPLSPPPLAPLEPLTGETGLQLLNNLEALANFNPPNDDMDTTLATTSPNNTNNRQRYRLVVYFEERSQQEQPSARYVAVIVGRLDELQFLLSNGTNERGFADVLNNLFNAYAPKGTPPASKSSIDSLPTVTITEQDQSCMICLEHFEIGSTAVVLPCNHMFHGEECVKSWLKIHNSCPICRYELPVEDTEYETQRKERMLARGFHEQESQYEQQQQQEQDQQEQQEVEPQQNEQEGQEEAQQDEDSHMPDLQSDSSSDGENEEMHDILRDADMSFNNYLLHHHHQHHHESPSTSSTFTSDDNGHVDWLFDDTNPL